MAATGRTERSVGKPGEVKGCYQVQVKHSTKLVDVRFAGRCPESHAGIVNEDINTAESLLCLADDQAPLGRVCEIGAQNVKSISRSVFDLEMREVFAAA